MILVAIDEAYVNFLTNSFFPKSNCWKVFNRAKTDKTSKHFS